MLSRMRILTLMLLATFAAWGGTPKREFRGAWIQTIYQGYDKRSTEQNKAYLTQLLNDLQRIGINAVIFQIRPCADAFYQSDIEPWSSHLSGKTGKAPAQIWDPLQFMIDEAHKRGMELHAWLNPYRASTGDAVTFPANHILKTHPERFVKYGKGYYFNPALSENRHYICRVVADIINRYDVDGIHFDDYFYPYPIGKQKFADEADYAASGSELSLDDWRRQNVDLLIEQVHNTIADFKPWVRFGVSPFGIWRNVTSDPKGSNTAGLQNYDDLYADVPLWAEKGWIDYQIPQLYWEIDHKAAPYGELAPWWIANSRGRHVYLGQDAQKTAKAGELGRKMQLASEADGNCWWYAASLSSLSDSLSHIYATPALVPEYLWKPSQPADKPTSVEFSNGQLKWDNAPEAAKWVVYRFDSEKDIDIENPAAICAVTYSNTYSPARAGIYVVTALDRTNCESAPSSAIKVKL